MKQILLTCGAFALLTLPLAAYAEEIKVDRLGVGATSIVVNEEAGTITFVIKGQKKAVLDENGFHVRENIAYGGAIRDYSTSGFDEHIEAKEGKSDEQ